MSRILLGVSAGISIYKSLDLASKLTQRGDEVRTVMTPHALEFVRPLAFWAVTRQEVYTDTFRSEGERGPDHIALSEWPDAIVVAPATADIIARAAAGFGDNILSVILLATERPVVIAPAMNDRMWRHPIVQRNLGTLRELGYHVVEPESGRLACGSVGPGRLAETAKLMEAIDRALGAGKR